MWRSTLAIKILLVVIGFMVFSFGITGLWVGVGIALLLAGALMVFRQGQSAGHEACAVSKSVAAIGADKADKKMLSQMWSVSNGVRAIFAGAAVSYTINAIYIILSVVHAPEIATFVSRLVSWVITMPYWPIIAAWHNPLPTKNASSTSAGVVVSSNQKNGKANTARPTAPPR